VSDSSIAPGLIHGQRALPGSENLEGKYPTVNPVIARAGLFGLVLRNEKQQAPCTVEGQSVHRLDAGDSIQSNPRGR